MAYIDLIKVTQAQFNALPNTGLDRASAFFISDASIGSPNYIFAAQGQTPTQAQASGGTTLGTSGGNSSGGLKQWQATTAYVQGQIVVATTTVGTIGIGDLIISNSNRTSTATFDITEAANWTEVADDPDLLKKDLSNIGSSVVALANGGTGSSTASGARTNLGLVIGTNVQAWDADLDTWATKTAPSGSAVGTSDTQTLTNKTLTSPAITGGTLADATDTTKKIQFGLSGITTSTTRTITAPNISGTLVLEPASPTYFLKTYTDTRGPHQYVVERQLVAVAPNAVGFTLTPAQVPVKWSAAPSQAEWLAQAGWAIKQLALLVGEMPTTGFNDTIGDFAFATHVANITDATYCSNPITNTVGYSMDADHSVVTALPGWSDSLNELNIIRVVVGTDGTNIYWVNCLIVASGGAGTNQYTYFESGFPTASGWSNFGTASVPAMRTSTQLQADVDTNIRLNNNRVGYDQEHFVALVAPIRFPI